MSTTALKPSAQHGSPSPRATHAGDLHGWAFEQARLLREGRFDLIDAANIAEEIEDVGKSEYRELESAFRVLVHHLLKWDYQPERRSRSWMLSIAEQRNRIGRTLRKNPGLTSLIPEALLAGWEDGRLRASAETDLDLSVFPEACPWTFEALMSRDLGLSTPER